ncbi:polysaccharide pyruvyl transferase family protein [Plebeiibacterium sediminum]|uniref:Polysaccharide pyruvyl transferase domain-containing protein n=1 Tax=Plebeiibacterium sediminum TaxID=2992112 RepID=A0AAE3SHF7_9BACT|nr:polysaccharide pyruvyl transferase family protein [Plebeiobacterium sediminum]MCW3789197.1 hypothetical protein [Plebeiobacterium sediminum]
MILKEFYLLAETIKNISKGKKIYYVANPGNWGDALIRYATIKFFNDHNIKFKELRAIKKTDWIIPILKHGVLVYGGGGAWCENWNHSYNILKNKTHLFKKTIVLPSTYQGEYKLTNTLFFRRDEFESKKFMPESVFCHDMVLYLDSIKTKFPSKYCTGNFFRMDKEGSGKAVEIENNVDITRDKDIHSPIYPFIDELSKCNEINTDKLHIAILGSLLNRKVNFYPGNYFKNKAVYFSSIKDFFPNTNFID